MFKRVRKLLKTIIELPETLERLECRLDEIDKTAIKFTPIVNPLEGYSWTYEPCQHEYPEPWFGTVPPHCLKCGKQAYTYTTGRVCNHSTNNGLGINCSCCGVQMSGSLKYNQDYINYEDCDVCGASSYCSHRNN